MCFVWMIQKLGEGVGSIKYELLGWCERFSVGWLWGDVIKCEIFGEG